MTVVNQEPEATGIGVELRPHEHTPQCPKCMAQEVQINWHACCVVKEPPYPCSHWDPNQVPEHLCLMCWRCHFQWATWTADAGSQE